VVAEVLAVQVLVKEDLKETIQYFQLSHQRVVAVVLAEIWTA
jgi:hypothetical protein